MTDRNRKTFRKLAIVTGDHHAADPTKLGAAYGPQDLATHAAMVDAFQGLGRFDIAICNDHSRLFEQLEAQAPDLVVNFCDTGIGNRPDRELNLPAWLELKGIPYTGAPPRVVPVKPRRLNQVWCIPTNATDPIRTVNRSPRLFW